MRSKDSTAEAYMKFPVFTLSILALSCALILAGCDSLELRNPFLPDQVPPEAKAEPRLVETPSPSDNQPQTWPRLGDVPFKPKDFSPKPAYDHYMDELEYDRAESEAAKKRVGDESPTLPDAAPLDTAPQTPALPDTPLMPPQFFHSLKE